MKKVIILGIVLLFVMTLSACDIMYNTTELEIEYCTEHPEDVRCDDIDVPEDNEEDVTCNVGYVLQEGNCVLEEDDTNEPLTCQVGYHEELGECVPDQQQLSCGDDYVEYNSQCLNPWELPVDHIAYEPNFQDCYDDTCIYPILTLAEENDYFESFTLYIKASELQIIDEFELHYVLKDETEIFVNYGSTFHWCSPWMNCEDLFKVMMYTQATNGGVSYDFDFWYNDTWYGEIFDLSFETWNETTEEYDVTTLTVNAFYLGHAGNLNEEE